MFDEYEKNSPIKGRIYLRGLLGILNPKRTVFAHRLFLNPYILPARLLTGLKIFIRLRKMFTSNVQVYDSYNNAGYFLRRVFRLAAIGAHDPLTQLEAVDLLQCVFCLVGFFFLTFLFFLLDSGEFNISEYNFPI